MQRQLVRSHVLADLLVIVQKDNSVFPPLHVTKSIRSSAEALSMMPPENAESPAHQVKVASVRQTKDVLPILFVMKWEIMLSQRRPLLLFRLRRRILFTAERVTMKHPRFASILVRLVPAKNVPMG